MSNPCAQYILLNFKNLQEINNNNKSCLAWFPKQTRAYQRGSGGLQLSTADNAKPCPPHPHRKKTPRFSKKPKNLWSSAQHSIETPITVSKTAAERSILHVCGVPPPTSVRLRAWAKSAPSSSRRVARAIWPRRRPCRPTAHRS